MTIDQYAEIADPKMFNLNDKCDFYNPVQFSLAIYDNGEALKMRVPYEGNENWYSNLLQGVSDTIGRSVTEIKTINGTVLSELDDPRKAGKLNVFTTDGKYYAQGKSLIVPVQFSVTKDVTIKSWIKEATISLPEKVANILKDKDLVGIDIAVRKDGAVQKLIEDELKSKTKDWTEFVRVHHIKSPDELEAREANVVLTKISETCLSQIRSYLGAATEKIRQLVNVAPSGGGKNLGSALFVGRDSSIDGFDLYKKLMKSAICSAAMGHTIFDTIYLTPLEPAMVVSPKLLRPADHHPRNAQIHHSILPIKGSYPSDYILRHTRENMTISAPFSGDVEETYATYHNLAGLHPLPPAVISARRRTYYDEDGKKQRKKRGQRHQKWFPTKKKPTKKEQEQQQNVKEYVPIEYHHNRKRRDEDDENYWGDELVPIEGNSGSPKLVPIDRRHRNMPKKQEEDEYWGDELVPIEGNSGSPKLVPIDRKHHGATKKHQEEDDYWGDELVPIEGNSGSPKLVPIDRHHKNMPKHQEEDEYWGDELVPIEGNSSSPRLVPIDRKHRGTTKKHQEEDEYWGDELVPIEGKSGSPKLVPIDRRHKNMPKHQEEDEPIAGDIDLSKYLKIACGDHKKEKDEDEDIECGIMSGKRKGGRRAGIRPIEDDIDDEMPPAGLLPQVRDVFKMK